MGIGISIGFDKNGTFKIESGNISIKNKREFKGKSIIDIPNEFIIIDIETTGLDPEYSEIIEIAGIKVSDNQVVDTFQSLVKPEEEITSYITHLTGITNEMVADAPMIEKVLISFEQFIGNSILMGHNVNFDINFLYDNSLHILDNPLKNDFIDTWRFARKFITETKNHKLITLAKYYGLDTTNSHRALKDCELTLEIYKKIIQIANEQNLDIKEAYKRRTYEYSSNANNITSQVTEFDENHLLFGQHCVFTGKLEHFVRKDAMQLLANFGGIPQNGVNKDTNYLILGNLDFVNNIKDGKSSKVKKAEDLILKGQDLKIISENIFYDLIGENL